MSDAEADELPHFGIVRIVEFLLFAITLGLFIGNQHYSPLDKTDINGDELITEAEDPPVVLHPVWRYHGHREPHFHTKLHEGITRKPHVPKEEAKQTSQAAHAEDGVTQGPPGKATSEDTTSKEDDGTSEDAVLIDVRPVDEVVQIGGPDGDEIQGQIYEFVQPAGEGEAQRPGELVEIRPVEPGDNEERVDEPGQVLEFKPAGQDEQDEQEPGKVIEIRPFGPGGETGGGTYVVKPAEGGSVEEEGGGVEGGPAEGIPAVEMRPVQIIQQGVTGEEQVTIESPQYPEYDGGGIVETEEPNAAKPAEGEVSEQSTEKEAGQDDGTGTEIAQLETLQTNATENATTEEIVTLKFIITFNKNNDSQESEDMDSDIEIVEYTEIIEYEDPVYTIIPVVATENKTDSRRRREPHIPTLPPTESKEVMKQKLIKRTIVLFMLSNLVVTCLILAVACLSHILKDPMTKIPMLVLLIFLIFINFINIGLAIYVVINNSNLLWVFITVFTITSTICLLIDLVLTCND